MPSEPEVAARLLPFVARTAAAACGEGRGSRTLADASLVFADVSGFTRLSERLADLGREGTEGVKDAINTVFGFIGTICLLQIIYGGYEWATGNLTGKTEEGKTRIRNAIISFVIALLSFAIVDMIVSIVVQ